MSRSAMKPLDVDLAGRRALVTGANGGMGKETARELARIGAEVILGCRSLQRGEAARIDITNSTGATGVSVMELRSVVAGVGARLRQSVLRTVRDAGRAGQ